MAAHNERKATVESCKTGAYSLKDDDFQGVLSAHGESYEQSYGTQQPAKTVFGHSGFRRHGS